MLLAWEEECLRPLQMGSMLLFTKHPILIFSSALVLYCKSTLSKAALELDWEGGGFYCLCSYFDNVYKDLHSENYLWLEYEIPNPWVALQVPFFYIGFQETLSFQSQIK